MSQCDKRDETKINALVFFFLNGNSRVVQWQLTRKMFDESRWKYFVLQAFVESF